MRPNWMKRKRPLLEELPLPAAACSFQFDWDDDYRPTAPDFLGQRTKRKDLRDLYLFAQTYDLSRARCGDNDERMPGFIVEYQVVEFGPKGRSSARIHRLLQRDDVMYVAQDGIGEFDVCDLRAQEIAANSMGRPPAWKPEDATWPTHEGALMKFVGRWKVRLREHGANDYAFLFTAHVGDGAVFAAFKQRIAYQSAEDHYALEEKLGH